MSTERIYQRGALTGVPASRYAYQHLAQMYNDSRVDYIVPMPMNARRMQEYITHYDVALDASYVAINEEQLECGLGMLGIRGQRGWLTRLGVIPERRGHKIGQFLMEIMIEEAAARGVMEFWLEVIVGNEPAQRLFDKLGFMPTRELLVIRRPPGMPTPRPEYDDLAVMQIPTDQIPAYLALREPGASWVEDTPSLLNGGNLYGLSIDWPPGYHAWIIFQQTAFQLSHFVLSPHAPDEALQCILYQLHKAYPMTDTKVENIPVGHHDWDIFQKLGYLIAFRRIEMVLRL